MLGGKGISPKSLLLNNVMPGLHVLMVDGVVLEVIQVDQKGGTKMLKAHPTYTPTIEKWHWEIIKEINECMS
jgi:hypothetical protein